MSLLEVKNLSHMYGDKKLYNNAEFQLHKGEHMGIVGINGSGKSTLLNILCDKIIPDEGSVKWQSNISVGVLDQYAEISEEYTVYDYLKTAFEDLYKIEEKLNRLYEEMVYDSDIKIMNKTASYYSA